MQDSTSLTFASTEDQSLCKTKAASPKCTVRIHVVCMSGYFVGPDGRHIDRQYSLNIQLAAGIRTIASDNERHLSLIEDKWRSLDTIYRLIKIG